MIADNARWGHAAGDAISRGVARQAAPGAPGMHVQSRSDCDKVPQPARAYWLM